MPLVIGRWFVYTHSTLGEALAPENPDRTTVPMRLCALSANRGVPSLACGPSLD